jgi:hypothetical protein
VIAEADAMFADFCQWRQLQSLAGTHAAAEVFRLLLYTFIMSSPLCLCTNQSRMLIGVKHCGVSANIDWSVLYCRSSALQIARMMPRASTLLSSRYSLCSLLAIFFVETCHADWNGFRNW